ncbi:hypothetical protein [Microbacterium sp. BR1]|uniref:hypothetical protein n=1 Tax=Microbacterium sp. BR1 TaxID=1070896 RepID=UPI000C2C0658|nr:hypothetical protein [Microbacterium sp. BR1]
MLTRRSRSWIIATAVVAVSLVAIGVIGEVALRGRLSERVDTLAATMPGVDVSLAGPPVLWQMATGRVEMELTATDAALDALAACSSEQELGVRAVPGGLVVSLSRTVRGMSVPIDVILVPHREADGGWVLVADSVSAGGITIPAERALNLLEGRDGASAGFAARLRDGIRLPHDADTEVTHVEFTEGVARLDLALPVTPKEDAEDGALSRIRSCVDDPESPEG